MNPKLRWNLLHFRFFFENVENEKMADTANIAPDALIKNLVFAHFVGIFTPSAAESIARKIGRRRAACPLDTVDTATRSTRWALQHNS